MILSSTHIEKSLHSPPPKSHLIPSPIGFRGLTVLLEGSGWTALEGMSPICPQSRTQCSLGFWPKALLLIGLRRYNVANYNRRCWWLWPQSELSPGQSILQRIPDADSFIPNLSLVSLGRLLNWNALSQCHLFSHPSPLQTTIDVTKPDLVFSL